MATALLLLIFYNVANAGEHYQTTDDLITHFYQKGSDEDAPWHKNRGEISGASDYSLCYNKQVSQHPPQYLVVMCPDINSSTYANEQAATDVYVIQPKEQGFFLLASERDVEGEFQEVVNIGSGQWAIHISTHDINQGYEQSHDELSVFIKNKFIPVANWTSLQNNEGAIDPDDTQSKEKAESITNTLTIDASQKDVEFYPIIIHSVGYRGKAKIDKSYRIIYSMDKGKYVIPDELDGGY